MIAISASEWKTEEYRELGALAAPLPNPFSMSSINLPQKGKNQVGCAYYFYFRA